MRRRATLALVVLVVTAGCSAVAPAAPDGGTTGAGDAQSMTVTSVWVEDGDTLWFENATGEAVGVRLLGVDTPETRGQNYPAEYPGIPDSSAGQNWLYRWGRRATNATRDFVEGEEVRLVFDPSLPRRDFYHRLVAYVYVDGELLNRELLERGLARLYPVEHEKREEFRAVVRRAKADERGLWNYSGNASGERTTPAEGRRVPPPPVASVQGGDRTRATPSRPFPRPIRQPFLVRHQP